MKRITVVCCALISVGLILLFTMITWTNNQLSELKSRTYKFINIQSSRPTFPSLQLQDPNHFANETDFKCVTAKLDQMGFPLCTYNEADDIYISRAVLKGDYFERDYVLRTLNFMKKHHDITFLDIGANLGSYALPVAHVGRHVVAVEPNWNTLRRLSKSIYLGKVSHNIDLLPNAIADKRSKTFMKYNPVNRGRSEMSDEASCEKDCVNVSVSVITLDDLLPLMRNKKVIIKIDVEGSEINVFTSSSADEFFRKVDVLIIQMEWNFYLKFFTQTLEKRLSVDKFINFFYEKGYAMYNVDTEKSLDKNWTKWPVDICIAKANKAGHLYDL